MLHANKNLSILQEKTQTDKNLFVSKEKIVFIIFGLSKDNFP
jgi:hypothetical protein